MKKMSDVKKCLRKRLAELDKEQDKHRLIQYNHKKLVGLSNICYNKCDGYKLNCDDRVEALNIRYYDGRK